MLWLDSLGLPQSGTFALEFMAKDRAKAMSLFTIQQMFGVCVWDDAYAVPDHGRVFFGTSHHDVVYGYCRLARAKTELIRVLRAEGFSLPVAPPDASLRVPDWMRKARRK
jgi:hypothetical protein